MGYPAKEMAHTHLKGPAAIALSGLTGAGIGFTYTELLLGLTPLPQVIFLCSVGIFPLLGGWLSSRAGNCVFFPVNIFIGISVALPLGNEAFAIMLVLASSLFQGTLATIAFFVGYGAPRLLSRKKQ